MSERAAIPDALVQQLRRAAHVVVLTGAGISAESGVPTFRQAQTGLWAQYDPQALATPQAFRRQPQLVWDWYAWRRGLVAGVEPNPGHFALAEMERRVNRFTLITQNVDSLHQRAGSRAVLELHGNIARIKCSRDGRVVETWAESDERPPRCSHCGAFLRPDVVWFGEPIPGGPLLQAADAASRCDVFFSIGTSALVYPAAGLAEAALKSGATVIEINPNRTDLTPHAHLALQGPSGRLLPALLQLLRVG